MKNTNCRIYYAIFNERRSSTLQKLNMRSKDFPMKCVKLLTFNLASPLRKSASSRVLLRKSANSQPPLRKSASQHPLGKRIPGGGGGEGGRQS